MIKVGLILGIAGACRADELINLTVDDIEDVGSSLIVKIPDTKTKIPRIFVVTDVGNMLELFRKYLSLLLPVKHKRLFLYYKAGKCSSQPVSLKYHGKNSSVVASYLKLLMLHVILVTAYEDLQRHYWQMLVWISRNKASCRLEINDSR
ncbi:hypothetical protein NQ317_011139 [Molorchus minor]|uniref:Tyr recombinase domain-containing protein n=1 Tax=Molorchus minor TaxID=1323400 RepID=A0ABQ9IU49_9CUCU|nr:hypothetical protein NQ317_011139 [Molorchus minor]